MAPAWVGKSTTSLDQIDLRQYVVVACLQEKISACVMCTAVCTHLWWLQLVGVVSRQWSLVFDMCNVPRCRCTSSVKVMSNHSPNRFICRGSNGVLRGLDVWRTPSTAAAEHLTL